MGGQTKAPGNSLRPSTRRVSSRALCKAEVAEDGCLNFTFTRREFAAHGVTVIVYSVEAVELATRRTSMAGYAGQDIAPQLSMISPEYSVDAVHRRDSHQNDGVTTYQLHCTVTATTLSLPPAVYRVFYNNSHEVSEISAKSF